MVAVGSKCRTCRGPAIIDLPRHNANFCAEHFMELCRRQVAKAIEQFTMLTKDDRVLVAVSGGKDSLA
ncbi:MAG: tRNA-5-methyluridine54 2-sulfurtransferase, partial [Ilumatobacteraceae bacterium]